MARMTGPPPPDWPAEQTPDGRRRVWVRVALPGDPEHWTLIEPDAADGGDTLARWVGDLCHVLAHHVHEFVPDAAIDGIGRDRRRVIWCAGHAVTVAEGAAVHCACGVHAERHACVHRMAVALRLWQREMVGAGCPLDGCDPYAVPFRALLILLVDRYLSPSPERLRARQRARFAALRERDTARRAAEPVRAIPPGATTRRVPLL